MGLTVVSFILVMSVLVFVHEFGHFIVAKRNGIIVDEFGFGFPPRLVKLGERDGTVYTINAIPFGGFVRLRGEDDPSEPGSFAAAPKRARTFTLLAGPVMNLLLAIILFAALYMLTGVPDPTRSSGAFVDSVAANSPAAEAGLQSGDQVVSVAGQPVKSTAELVKLTSANLGRPVSYQVERVVNGARQIIEITMVPRENPPPGQGALGITLATATRPAAPWEAAWYGVQYVWFIIVQTFAIPANLIREGKPIADAGFMGPVGMAALTGQVVRSSIAVDSIRPILNFMGLLSTALGVTNLLPVPGLDGGRLLFVIVEAIRRKRIEPMQEGMVHLIGLGLLLVLMAILTVHEVTALLQGTFPNIAR